MQVSMFEVASDGVQLGHNYTVNMYVLRCRVLPPRLASKAGRAVPLLIIPGPRDPKCGLSVFTCFVLSLIVPLGSSSGATLPCICRVTSIDLDATYDCSCDAGAKISSRTLFVSRRAVPECTAQQLEGLVFNPETGYTNENEGGGGSSARRRLQEDRLQEDLETSSVLSGSQSSACEQNIAPEDLIAVPLEAVLVSITGDYPGRSKLTNWQYQSGKFNGGWCKCRHRSHKTEVRLFVTSGWRSPSILSV